MIEIKRQVSAPIPKSNCNYHKNIKCTKHWWWPLLFWPFNFLYSIYTLDMTALRIMWRFGKMYSLVLSTLSRLCKLKSIFTLSILLYFTDIATEAYRDEVIWLVPFHGELCTIEERAHSCNDRFGMSVF